MILKLEGKGTSLMFLSVISVSLSILASKFCLLLGVDSSHIVMFRFLIPLLIITPLFITNPELKKSLILHNVLRSLWLFFAQFLLIYSMNEVSIGSAVALYYLAPVYIALMQSVKTKSISIIVILSSLIGFTGVVFIVYNGDFIASFNTHTVAAISAGWFFAMSQVWVHKLSEKQRPLTSLFYTYLLALIPAAAVAGNFQGSLLMQREIPIYIVLVGLFSFISQLFRVLAYRKTRDVSKLAPILYFSVLFTTLDDILIFNKSINYHFIFGAVCIITSTTLVRKSNGS